MSRNVLIFTVCAIVEIGVGIIVLIAPRVLSLLLDVNLDPHGLVVARMVAIAALALGLTWWSARRAPRPVGPYAAGFLAYNIGMGLLFSVAAVAASRPFLPWLVAAFHLLAAVALLAMMREHSN